MSVNSATFWCGIRSTPFLATVVFASASVWMHLFTTPGKKNKTITLRCGQGPSLSGCHECLSNQRPRFFMSVLPALKKTGRITLQKGLLVGHVLAKDMQLYHLRSLQSFVFTAKQESHTSEPSMGGGVNQVVCDLLTY